MDHDKLPQYIAAVLYNLQILHINRRYQMNNVGIIYKPVLYYNKYKTYVYCNLNVRQNVKNYNKHKINENIELYSQNTMTKNSVVRHMQYKIYVYFYDF